MRKRIVVLVGAILVALMTAAYVFPMSVHGISPSQIVTPLPTQSLPTGTGQGLSVLPTVPPTPFGATFSAVTTPVPESSNTGATAIRPTRSTTDPATPAFTTQDVTDYVDAHPIEQTVPGTKPTIESIQFLPNREVNSRFTTSTGRPDDALMCLVTLRGSFFEAGPAGGAGIKSDVAYWVFDAHTGNELLIVGG
jgi:hypothetical protein